MTGQWPFGDLLPGRYAAILADPPWHFRARTALQVSDWTSRRDVEKHYQVMDAADIAALPVKLLAAKDAHLFLWTTGPCLRLAFDVIEAWGFRYSAVAFSWVKLKRRFEPMQLRFVPTADADLHVGLGLTTQRTPNSASLVGAATHTETPKTCGRSFMAPVREHSRKPDEVADRIERYCDGPYAELFARRGRLGWDSWGNETDKFSEAAQ